MPMTKTERIARDRLFRQLWAADEEVLNQLIRDQVPDAWHTLEADLDVEEPKVKVTLYLDASIVKVFRAMGQGYQARINRVLATWAQMKIAGLLDSDGHVAKRRAEVLGERGPD
jgi:uncharacterized protein (DUF4415 family)